MDEKTRKSTLRRVHSLTGVVPLGGYLVLHLGETAQSSGDRRDFARALSGASDDIAWLIVEALLVLVPLLIHVVLGLTLAWRDRSSQEAWPHSTTAMRGVQRATGVVALLFLAVHLSHTYVLALQGADGAMLYDILRRDLGTPLYLGVYALGLACVCAHFALGLPAALRRFELVQTSSAFRVARVLSAITATVLFLIAINTASHFAVGRSFVGESPSAPSSSDSAAAAESARPGGAP